MRVAVTTLGCKVNQYDTAVMRKMFAQRGWRTVDFSERADAYVVNTCTVTDRADGDARRHARRARRLNPGARVIMTGCYAQTSPEQIARLDYVDHVVGLGRLDDLLAAVEGELSETTSVGDLRAKTAVETLGISSFPGRSRAYVKVQEGCDLFCTFCIVPVARGPSRSVGPRQVLQEIERLAAHGYREVVITGVHLGAYGTDLDPPRDLPWLLETIAERNLPLRVRISSIDPPEVTARLLDVIAGNPVFCRHLHIPLQAGDDDVLQRMGRKYSSAEAAERLAEVRSRIGRVCIGTDIITGFPAESEEAFGRTLAFVENVGVNYLHVFPYSRRRATAAAKRWKELPRSLVHQRAALMRGLGKRLRRNFEKGFIGQRATVLYESVRDRSTGLLKGYSDNYLPVLGHGDDSLMNRLVEVEIAGHMDGRLESRQL